MRNFLNFKKFKMIILYFGLFLVFLIWNLLIQPLNLDEVWNYGFSHNIYSGLVPYKDFNMILTPLYPFIMSFGFKLFGSNMLIFHIEHAIILTVLCFFLFKLLHQKAWIVILFLFFPLSVSFPSYNIFLFFLFVICIYLEEMDSNDYLIGFILGLFILTKHSVGLCLILPSLYYIRKNKFIKRIIGAGIPILIFFLYLIVSNSLNEFLDLCVFGLFDFASSNGRGLNIYYFLTLILVILTFVFIRKNSKDIKNYYVLAFYSIIIPLFDMYHFQVAFLGFLLIFMYNYKRKIPINLCLLTLGSVLCISIIIGFDKLNDEIIYPNNINHFEYKLLDIDSINLTEEVNDFINQNVDKEFVFLNANGYYFRIANDMPISYIDLINQGNWGYNGSDKLFNKVKSMKDAIFIVDETELSKTSQIDKKVLKYVIKHGKKIKSIRIYDFYVLEK